MTKQKKLIIAIIAIIVVISALWAGIYLTQNQQSEELSAPLSIVDGIGRAVTITEYPNRIVSIAPSCTEIVFALNLKEKLVGAPTYSGYSPEIQERIMNFVGIDKEEAHEKFGFLLDAYQYGSPTHGGMGIGVDRLVALVLGLEDIREVIAFPKNTNAQCTMDGSPGNISEEQLNELGIKIK